MRESTLGTTPATPRMRIARITGESLAYSPKFVTSEEIRSDRTSADPVKINEDNSGAVNFELFYPASLSAQSEFLQSALMSTWINTPEWDNDGTADSVITQVTSATGVLTVASGGAAVIAGHLIRTTGFAATGNNVVAKATASTGTSITTGASIFSADDAAPAAAARIKVVGFEGASGDIVAAAGGLTSTVADFTTLGLRVGQWVKIGGSAAGNKFAITAANNDWARVTAIAAHALSLDNLPAGWGVDAGTGKSIRMWFGDVLVNGTTIIGLSVERSFLDQATPTHILQKGLVGGQYSLDYTSEATVKASITLSGLSGGQSTTAIGSAYAAAPTGTAMSSNVSVGRIAEGGSTVSSPNWVKSAKINLNNNLRQIMGVGNVGAVGVSIGECLATGSLETYFGDNTMLAKLLAGTASSISLRATLNGQAFISQVPRLIFTGGAPNAGGKNQDIVLPLSWQASLDSVTGAQILFDRLEYFTP